MATPSIQKRSRKQELIIESAEKLFMRHGIKRISVEEICRTAQVSKMTFYKYFSNKIELVKYIWNTWAEESFARLDEINAMDIPFPEKIELMFEWNQQFSAKASTEFLEEIISIDLDLERFKNRFLDFIIAAQKRGDIRPEIRPEFFAAVMEKLRELAHDDDLTKIYPTFMDFRRELKDFFWYGVLARSKNGS
jgi:AcrR family transcriptional regulator